MLNRHQTLAVPAKMIEHGMVNLKKEALFYDRIIIASHDIESEARARDEIGVETSQFLEDQGILFFGLLEMFLTDDPPPTVTEIEIALVAAWKISFINEMLAVGDQEYTKVCRQIQAQAHSRLAVFQLKSLLPDSHILPVDFGHRWTVSLEEDRRHDIFESIRYERTFRVDPPLNKWNF